jgi:hypothetical protein
MKTVRVNEECAIINGWTAAGEMNIQRLSS